MIRRLMPWLSNVRSLRAAARAFLLRRRLLKDHDRYSHIARFLAREPETSEHASIDDALAAKYQHLLNQGYGRPRNVARFKRKERAG